MSKRSKKEYLAMAINAAKKNNRPFYSNGKFHKSRYCAGYASSAGTAGLYEGTPKAVYVVLTDAGDADNTFRVAKIARTDLSTGDTAYVRDSNGQVYHLNLTKAHAMAKDLAFLEGK